MPRPEERARASVSKDGPGKAWGLDIDALLNEDADAFSAGREPRTPTPESLALLAEDVEQTTRELEFLDLYLGLEQYRFADRMQGRSVVTACFWSRARCPVFPL